MLDFAVDENDEIFRIYPPNEWYEVSTKGRVRRSLKHPKRPKFISQNSNASGYARVSLSAKGQIRTYTCRVHRMVLETFIGPCPAGMEACHNDGNKLNNHLSNLRWDNHKNNNADKHIHGTRQIGERNSFAKLKNADIIRIRALLREGWKKTTLARMFSVHKTTIYRIHNGQMWGDVVG